MAMLEEQAPAKVNLSLHVLGRRADGYHELESIVVFASAGDHVSLEPATELTLEVAGETAAEAGPSDDNLVLKAARALRERIPALRAGTFRLTKRLPVAAGLGGGSADAAAALRLLARRNSLALDDERVLEAAAATGADCTVCLASRPAFMRGIGHDLTPLESWPALAAVLVNPRVPVPTRPVFDALALTPGAIERTRAHPPLTGTPMAILAAARNDLAPPARHMAPVIADVEAALIAHNASLARMSGSGATVFGVFPDWNAAALAARTITAAKPAWWVRATVLGGSAT